MTREENHTLWLDRIQSCRASGLSDYEWCRSQSIPISSFYYHVKRLRQDACAVPKTNVLPTVPEVPDIVKLNVVENEALTENHISAVTETPMLHLHFQNITIDIPRGMDEHTISQTLRALRHLC